MGESILNAKVRAALDGFQDSCNRRMAKANAAHEPKEPLFHYTNEAALFSILDSDQFWFCSVYHMDDPTELRFGHGVASALLVEASKRSKGVARAFCQELGTKEEFEHIKKILAFYSVSFGLRDVAQQWTDYANAGQGVAFGLAPAFFRPAPFEDPDDPKPEAEIFYGKVSYGQADSRARHEKVIDGALAVIEQVKRRRWINSRQEAQRLCRELAATMYTEIIWNCVTTKDTKWSHQNEMRLLARNFLINPKLPIINPDVRPRVELKQPRLKDSLVEVMIGPKAAPETVDRVRNGLADRGFGRIPVNKAKAV